MVSYLIRVWSLTLLSCAVSASAVPRYSATVIGPLAGYSAGCVKPVTCPLIMVSGINASGQVVGCSNGHGFLYANGGLTDLTMWGMGCASGINDSSQIIGFALGGGAALFSKGTVIPMPWFQLPSAINNSGQIVGLSTDGKSSLIYSTNVTTNL